MNDLSEYVIKDRVTQAQLEAALYSVRALNSVLEASKIS
jgi:hypothetical protein